MSKTRRNAAILATRPSVAQPFGMTDRPKDQQKQNRNRRLSTALRDNLKRRKAQAKGRSLKAEGPAEGEAGPSTGTHDSAGFAEDKRNR
jgi:hypothetical protein